MIANLWMGFDDRAQSKAKTPDEDGNLHPVNRSLGDPSVRSIFKQDNPSGPRTYELWSLYYRIEAEKELRDIRNDLNAEFPGQVRTIGSWWWDGRMVGQEWVIDEDGNRIGTSGNPIFPLHTSILGYMPDVWNGDDPPTFSPATSVRDVNLGLGQIPRRFT